jgi:hypothetical protein
MTFNHQGLYARLLAYNESRHKISTYRHQLPDKELYPVDLEAFLHHSYVNWCGVSEDSSAVISPARMPSRSSRTFFLRISSGFTNLPNPD